MAPYGGYSGVLFFTITSNFLWGKIYNMIIIVFEYSCYSGPIFNTKIQN